MDILYKTLTMLKAITQLNTRKTFLRDRYFPTNGRSDIFPTEEVLVEYKNGSKKMAPCVLPRKAGITVEREGYQTKRYTPPLVAVQRPLTIDDLNKKGFGEQLFSNITPAQRVAEILRNDLLEFDDLISAREEYIAAQAMLKNGYVLKHYADSYGSDNFVEYEMRFYDGQNNPAKYTPPLDWSDLDADILSDLYLMSRMLTSRGLPATDLILAPDVADCFINNKKIQTLLDNRNINIGNITPIELPNGASQLCKLNVHGKIISVFCYDETYEDEVTRKIEQFIPAGNAILTAPAAGRGLYGAVTQLEQSDGNFHTYLGKRVPKYTSDSKSETRELKVTSKPLYIPNNVNPWVSVVAIEQVGG